MLQSALVAAVVVASAVGPPWPDSVAGLLRALGIALVLAGGVLGVYSARSLGHSFTVFPRPRERAEVVERGPYRVVRHPIYSSGLLFLTGISLRHSPVALLVTAVLAVVWGMKARVEERFLAERFPGYAAYAARRRYRLLPFVY